MHILPTIALVQVRRDEAMNFFWMYTVCMRMVLEKELSIRSYVEPYVFIFDLAEGCGMPLSIVGGGGSFRKPNLQIAQTIESLQLIVKSLNQSEEKWWASPDTLNSIEAMKSSRNQDEQEDSSEPEPDDRVDYISDTSDKEDNSSDDEEEMVDLQAS